MKAQTHTRNIRSIALAVHKTEKHIIVLLLAGVVVLAVLYVYFLGSAVVHAVERKEVQYAIADAHSRIADLEVAYLSRKNEVTLALAEDLGFAHVATKSYVERTRNIGRRE